MTSNYVLEEFGFYLTGCDHDLGGVKLKEISQAFCNKNLIFISF